MDIGQLSLLIISLLLAGWYIGASIYNRRRGLVLARWLQAGLRSLGGTAGYTWIGSPGSGLRASVTGLSRPFRRLEAFVLLETRELLPLWLFQRLTNRRDQLILKCTLQHAAAAQLDAAPRLVTPAGWRTTQVTPALQLAASDAAGEQLAQALRPFFERYGAAVRSFSYRPQEPHVLLALTLAGVEGRPAEELVGLLARCLEPGR